MDLRAPALDSPSPKAVWRWGQAALIGGLSLSLLAVLYIAVVAPAAMIYLPVVIAGLAVAVILFRRPALNLFVVLTGFVLITEQEAGVQPAEAAYGLYFLAYLTSWFAIQRFYYQRPITSSACDRALAVFLLYAGASAIWALMYGATLSDIFGEAMTLTLLAFYYPIKEACSKDHKPLYILFGIIMWYALFTVVRNLMVYTDALASADQLYQIVRGRVALNEILLTLPALAALTVLVHIRKWSYWFVVGAIFLLSFVGLIVTQSRGYWAAFLLGAIVLVALTDRQRRLRIIGLATAGLITFVAVGMVAFPEVISLVTSGIVDRFATLKTAATSDLSLVNRFHESAAAWDSIKNNPILGHGVGAPFQYFNIIVDAHRTGPYIHNGYVALWFKYGLVGLSLFLFFWLRAIWLGVRLFRAHDAPLLPRVAGQIGAVCLTAELLVANTSNPMALQDALLLIAILAGAVEGSWVYIRTRR